MAQKKRSRSSKSSARPRSKTGRTPSATKRGRPTSKTTRASPGHSRKSLAPSPPEVLRAIARLAEKIGARWYLFGAHAVAIWGRPRMTADVDVTVEVDPSKVTALLRAAREVGLVPRERDVELIARESRVVPLQYGTPAIPVDLVLSGPGLEETFHERAIRERVGRVIVPVISPEDLVIAKLIAGRARDKEDVRGILAERSAELDLEYIRETLRVVEEALGRSDLLTSLDRLL